MARLHTKLIYFFLILTAFSLLISCSDERDQIPNVKFDVYIDITTQLADLPVSSAKTWTGGVNGLIIFRLEMYAFKAYDRTCPLHPLNNCIVNIENDLFAVCPCCDSQFTLPFDGAVNRGPSKYPLKQYRTSISNNRLHIYN